VESIAFSVVGGLGIDAAGHSIPYLTSWSQHDADIEIIEARAELIDRHAKPIETPSAIHPTQRRPARPHSRGPHRSRAPATRASHPGRLDGTPKATFRSDCGCSCSLSAQSRRDTSRTEYPSQRRSGAGPQSAGAGERLRQGSRLRATTRASRSRSRVASSGLSGASSSASAVSLAATAWLRMS
jgi:hypothetical protein